MLSYFLVTNWSSTRERPGNVHSKPIYPSMTDLLCKGGGLCFTKKVNGSLTTDWSSAMLTFISHERHVNCFHLHIAFLDQPSLNISMLVFIFYISHSLLFALSVPKNWYIHCKWTSDYLVQSSALEKCDIFFYIMLIFPSRQNDFWKIL